MRTARGWLVAFVVTALACGFVPTRKYPGPCTKESTNYTYSKNRTSLVTYTYDERGNVLTRKDDTDMDGTVDYQEIRTYDEDGNELTCRYDYSLGGSFSGYIPPPQDSGWTYTYDDNGNMLTAENDEGLDGEIDWNRVFTYDAEGRLIVQDEYYPVPRDDDHNGVPDAPSHVQGRFTYDEQGC
jgi:hypothetical protein